MRKQVALKLTDEEKAKVDKVVKAGCKYSSAAHFYRVAIFEQLARDEKLLDSSI